MFDIALGSRHIPTRPSVRNTLPVTDADESVLVCLSRLRTQLYVGVALIVAA